MEVVSIVYYVSQNTRFPGNVFLARYHALQRLKHCNTLSAIKINVLLFTCVLVSFLSRLKGI